MSEMDNNPAYIKAVHMQRKAASPDISVFVSANAGSGKTRVLVERVSRILLTGTNPDKIMCLTYTKAAAAEMQTRLFQSLGDWSIMPEEKLTDVLNALENKSGSRSRKDLNRARSLFARALETPGGLKVQTIHAFCERLLKRFPLEAEIAPGTDAIDERDAKKIQEQIWTDIETEAVQNPNGQLAADIALLAAIKNDEAMDAIYKWAMDNAYKIDAWQESGGVDALAKRLGITPDATALAILSDFWASVDMDNIKHAAAEMLRSKSKKNNKHGQVILDALSLIRGTSPMNEGREKADILTTAFDLYKTALFTKAGQSGEGDFFKTLVYGKDCPIAQRIIGDANTIGPEAHRAFQTRDKLRGVQVLRQTQAIYALSVLAVQKYRSIKQQRRVMDFGDMIHLACHLLQKSEARDWVRYKLDGGVDHILVDEAQDTSAVQWDIVDALSEEFFQNGAGTKTRTIFAVGDEKQSIYGFQGAQPELFLEKIQVLTKKQLETPNVTMSMSFRSTKQVLALVDKIFYKNKAILETFDAEKMPAGSEHGQHDAYRIDDGIIEFWPASQKPEIGEAEISWQPVPVDKLDIRSSREKLASEIAVQIQAWLKDGEPVYDRDRKTTRAMRPADILILVQKRTQFFDAIIRNLKSAGIPVAGADRLKLTDSIAVQDMLSLAKFTLLPADDLSLAEVLKSPLFGWDDDKLFDIAYGRKASLWAALPQGIERRTLSRIKSMASKYAPYEFFARTLALVPKDGGQSLLQKIYDRLGLEAADVLDVFLSRALSHQRRGAPSLQRFIADLEASESTIKREMDAGQNEVRVMTVHGAKGLEAPVVILPDTTQEVNIKQEKLFRVDAGFAMLGAQNQIPQSMQAVFDEKLADAQRESLRLLYVALTRAESRLLICGFKSGNAKDLPDNCWHRRIENALKGMESLKTIDTPFGDGWQYGMKAKAAETLLQASTKNVTLPPWARSLAVPPPPSVQFLSPSQLVKPNEAAAFDQAVRSPLNKVDDTFRFARGNLIHKLLEILPQIAPEKRHNAALSYLRKQGLDAASAQTLSAEIFAVIDNPDFALVFAPGSQAEVSLAGGAAELPDNMRLSGQIDRLCITNDTVWIVDYKSNRPPPAREQDVAPLYIRQMAAYRALARELYPNKTVRTALLWTDGPHMMVLSDALLDNVKWTDVLTA